jgi:2-C-methyl-D-erythritol 4-phosphate cytidylyltransferase
LDSPHVSAILTCAGKGTRFGGNKLLVDLDGMTVIERTVRSFLVPIVDEIVVMVDEENEPRYRKILLEQAKLPVKLIRGGKLRHLSAMNGLKETSGDIIVVHDGVRPFVTEKMINDVVAVAELHGAAMLGMPSTVQVKIVDEDGFVTGSLERSQSWLGQTPQAFRRDLLDQAYRSAEMSNSERVSDDAELVAEFTGNVVKIIEGHINNIKITTPQDLGTAEMIAAHRISEEG